MGHDKTLCSNTQHLFLPYYEAKYLSLFKTGSIFQVSMGITTKAGLYMTLSISITTLG